MSGKFLNDVLGHSEHIQELIKQSALELSSIDAGSRYESAIAAAPPGTLDVSNSKGVVTKQLQDAQEELTAVIQALRLEIKERTMVDYQLAAAIEQEEGCRNAALHDQLTGLPNRVLFGDRLQHGIAQAKRHHWILAVMFVDLDNFKPVNDAHGHQAGDAVLQTIATRLRHSTRDADTVSRYGGDEFLYLLNQIREENDIAMIARKVLKAIQAPCQVIVRGAIVNLCINASIGIAVFPRDGATAGALIKSADEAMYMAKEGKTGYAFTISGEASLCADPHRQLTDGGLPSIDAA